MALGALRGERNELLYNPPLEVMLQAVVTPGEKTSDGLVIEAVAIPWLGFLDHLKRNPGAIHAIDWRKMEEIIAAGYADSGYSVILTPRSGDKGRDVIATKHDGVSVRILDQVKAYALGHVVPLDVHSTTTDEDWTGATSRRSAPRNRLATTPSATYMGT